MMQKIILLFALSLSILSYSQAQIYTAKSGEASFFSEAPLENIEAKTKSVNSILNTVTKEIVFIVPMTTFQFDKALMKEHFNEKYVESHKYPNAQYKGKINEDIDFSKDGTYPATSTGTLTIHGVDKVYTEKGTVTIKGDQITIESQFNISIKDHKIEIPTVVSKKIAETVLVKIKADYLPYKK